MHDQDIDDPRREYYNYFGYMKALVGESGSLRFNQMLQSKIMPTVFKAFFDLYIDALTVHILKVFEELVGIGRANEQELETTPLFWAESQAKHMIRHHRMRIINWVRDVCGKQPFDSNADFDEQIYSQNWQAPRLVLMKPARNADYMEQAVWERLEPADSRRVLSAYADDYVVRLDVAITKLRDQAIILLAKEPRPNGAGNAVSPEEAKNPQAAQAVASAVTPLPGNVSRKSSRSVVPSRACYEL